MASLYEVSYTQLVASIGILVLFILTSVHRTLIPLAYGLAVAMLWSS